MEIEQLKSVLQEFKEFSHKNNFDFLVVGSMALNICGLPMKDNPHDLDIEVKSKSEDDHYRLVQLFSALADAYGNDYYKSLEYNIEGNTNKPFIFEFKGVILNIWLVKEFTHRYVYLDYIKYATVYSVLKAKMSYCRPKDYKDFNYVISELLKLCK